MRLFANPSNASFNLLRWFSLLSLVAIVLTSSLSAYLLFRFLADHLLERDARVSMEFIQRLSQINDPGPYFHGSDRSHDRVQLEEFFRHITRMPDVLRANVYAKNQTVIWSSDADLVGKRFGDNDELTKALTGRLVFDQKRRGEHGKIEHAYLPAEVDNFLESYVPIWDRQQRQVIGVVELYKAPTALFQALRRGQWLVAASAAFSGLVLYLFLAWIVRRAVRVMEQQQQALIEAEKLTVIGELTASVTHNLRNPLAAIRSSAELGLTEIQGPAREPVEDIIDEVDRLDRWVRELLVISRDVDDTQTAEVAGVVDSALRCFGQRLDKQSVQLSREIPEGLPALRANPDALSQVLISLIANAVEAMPNGGRLSLRAAGGPESDHVTLEIIDTGEGIDPQQQTDLFRPLVSHRAGGLGIGLPLARRIVQRYGGSLNLSSQPRVGTTMRLRLPVMR